MTDEPENADNAGMDEYTATDQVIAPVGGWPYPIITTKVISDGNNNELTVTSTKLDTTSKVLPTVTFKNSKREVLCASDDKVSSVNVTQLPPLRAIYEMDEAIKDVEAVPKPLHEMPGLKMEMNQTTKEVQFEAPAGLLDNICLTDAPEAHKAQPAATPPRTTRGAVVVPLPQR